jgi:hypothetical protein
MFGGLIDGERAYRIGHLVSYGHLEHCNSEPLNPVKNVLVTLFAPGSVTWSTFFHIRGIFLRVLPARSLATDNKGQAIPYSEVVRSARKNHAGKCEG